MPDTKELIIAGAQAVRELQRYYYQVRTKEALSAAKKAEEKLDKLLAAYYQAYPEKFSYDPAYKFVGEYKGRSK